MTEIVIHNAQDIIDALERHPEFLAQVRNHILTKRLLELPDQVDALVVSVKQLAETVAILADRVQRLEERMERVEDRQQVFDERQQVFDERQQVFDERQQRFEDRQQRFEDRQHGYDSQLRGDRYHGKVLRNIAFRAMTQLGMENPWIIAADGSPALPEWHRILQLALNRRDLTPDDIDELTETDIVLTDENGRHAAVEASVHADVHDVTRARRRADLLTKAAGQPAIAAVICATHSQEAAATAQAQNVALVHMRE